MKLNPNQTSTISNADGQHNLGHGPCREKVLRPHGSAGFTLATPFLAIPVRNDLAAESVVMAEAVGVKNVEAGTYSG